MKNKKKDFPASTSDRGPRRTIRTFVVDDDPIMLALLKWLLERDERIAIVGVATDSHKAFQPAAMSHPDLVLIDLHMPGLDGAQLTCWFKQLHNPPVIFIMTSDESREARTRSLAAGADAFLVKVTDLGEQLQSAIRNSFGEYLKPETETTSNP